MGKGRTNTKSRQQAASTKKNEQKQPKMMNLSSIFSLRPKALLRIPKKLLTTMERSPLDHQLALQENVNEFPLKRTWK